MDMMRETRKNNKLRYSEEGLGAYTQVKERLNTDTLWLVCWAVTSALSAFLSPTNCSLYSLSLCLCSWFVIGVGRVAVYSVGSMGNRTAWRNFPASLFSLSLTRDNLLYTCTVAITDSLNFILLLCVYAVRLLDWGSDTGAYEECCLLGHNSV
jgi:hypothetical protein